MVSVSVLGFEKFASQVRKIGTCHEICEKKRHHMGISQRSCHKQKRGSVTFLNNENNKFVFVDFYEKNALNKRQQEVQIVIRTSCL